MRFHAPAAALVALLVLGQPGVANARRPGTSFSAETQGVPIATEIGFWSESEDGRTVSLDFNGGHVVGGRTTFVARWLTPFTPAWKRSSFESDGEFANMNQFGDQVRIVESLRFRERGHKWSDWMGMGLQLPAQGYTAGGTGSIFYASRSRGMQFEWKLKGVIKAPAQLEGSYELHIN